MSLKSHALHHISIITVLSCILDVCNWLCAGRIGLGWTYDAISFACHMFKHFPCFRTPFNIFLWYLNYFWAFLFVSFFPLSILFTLVVSMAPKRKFTPAWNLLRSYESSSFDSAPLSLQFCNDDAHTAFSENFSRWGIHSEIQVILADFANTNLPTVIHSRG